MKSGRPKAQIMLLVLQNDPEMRTASDPSKQPFS
jgi:hypothetical protein